MKLQQGTTLSLMARVALVGLVLAPLSLLAQAPDPGSAPSSTQDGGPPPERGGHGGHGDPAERQQHMLQMMTKRLKLTPDQVTQIQGIQADQATQMKSLREDTSVQGADRRAKMMDLHKAENEKVRAVLNDEQRTKFDAMQARRQEHRHDGDGEQGPPPPPPPAQ